jgi:hypothetical protein
MQSAFSLSLGIAFLLAMGAAVALVATRRQRQRSRQRYQHYLEDALADGVLTEEEAEELANLRQDHALSETEVRMVALTIYRRALGNAMADSRITADEHATLRRLQTLLSLSDEDLRDDRQQMQRVHLLARIERAELPRVSAPLKLDPGEICHWVIQARLAQRLTIPGTPRRSLAHSSFTIDSNDPFHIDSARDVLASSEEVLPLDLGMFVVTSRRTLFRGARRNVAIPHIKLERVSVFADGVRLESSDAESNQLYLLDDAELTAAILLAAARSRKTEVRGAPSRTA